MFVRILSLAACLGCTVLVSGCLEVTTSTIAYEDGSLVRAISMTGDSTKVRTGPFPFYFDKGWKISRKALGDGRERVRAEQRFENADAMNKKLRGHGSRLEIHARYENHFDWFYTIHSYEETWKRYDPFNAVPVSTYLTLEEIDAFHSFYTNEPPRWRSRGDSKALNDAERRFELWRRRNMFESFYSALEVGVRRAQHPDLTPERLHAMKETLFVQCIDDLADIRTTSLPDKIGGILATPAGRAALAANDNEFRTFDEKKLRLKSIMEHSYTTRLRMPGMLQSTNSRVVKGSVCEWEHFIGYVMIGDYTISAKSRSLNWSFIILCIFIILAAIGVLLRFALRRRA